MSRFIDRLPFKEQRLNRATPSFIKVIPTNTRRWEFQIDTTEAIPWGLSLFGEEAQRDNYWIAVIKASIQRFIINDSKVKDNSKKIRFLRDMDSHPDNNPEGKGREAGDILFMDHYPVIKYELKRQGY